MIRDYKPNDRLMIETIGNQFNSNFSNLFNLDKNNIKIKVALKDNKIVGFIQVELGDTIDILNIIVEKEYRFQGLGNELLNRIIKESNKSIMLEVATDNIHAINLYQKNGFKIINERKNYYHQKNAYVMELKK